MNQPRPVILSPLPVGRASPRRSEPVPAAAGVVAAVLVAVVLLQRFAFPVGDFAVPVVLPLGLVVAAVLVAGGDLRARPQRVVRFAAGGGGLALAAYLASWESPVVRLSSLLIVLGVFSLWMLAAPGREAANHAAARLVLGCFVWLMVAAAAVGIGQMLAQVAGLWVYDDLIGTWVDGRFLVPDYNTSIAVEYGSPIHKSQAFVFLEPSIFSQFVALGLVAAAVAAAPVVAGPAPRLRAHHRAQRHRPAAARLRCPGHARAPARASPGPTCGWAWSRWR